jgi:MerR family transcriptional regulator, light-induced transcriptional regulator
LIRQKLIVAIDGQSFKSDGKKFLLFLPEGELHEISLLFATYLIKSKGHKVIYLGQNTPNEDLDSVYKLHHPDFLLTIITTSPSSEYVSEYIRGISERFSTSKILVTGYQVIGQDLTFPSNVQQLNYIREINEMLEELNEVYLEK